MDKKKPEFTHIPEKTIETEENLVDEIMNWANLENKKVTFIDYGMTPLIQVDNHLYQVRVERPTNTLLNIGMTLNRSGAIYPYVISFYKER